MQDVDETWMDKLLREGEEKGKRETLLTLLDEKFGPLPETLKARVEALESLDELDGYLKKILTASSLEDLGLDG